MSKNLPNQQIRIGPFGRHYLQESIPVGRGFTLVELMIVIAIMMVLVSIAIPAIRFLTKNDAVREAARTTNLFIESARAEAISEGFAGVWLERDNDLNKVTRIYKVRRPPLYSGDYADVKAYVQPLFTGMNFNRNKFNVYFVESENTLFANSAGANPQPGIKINDRIQLAGKGPWYQILTNPVTDTHPTLTDGMGNPVPAFRVEVALNTLSYDNSNNYSGTSFNNYLVPLEGESTFLIERAPTISTRDYLQLPKGTYINLKHSGFAVDPSVDLTMLVDGESLGGNEFASDTTILDKLFPIVITFREDGSVDRVDYQLYPTAAAVPNLFTPTSEFPRTNLFLHVAAESETLDANHEPLEDLDNVWVMISRSNGTVMTGNSLTVTGSANDPEARANSRRGVRDGQNQTAN